MKPITVEGLIDPDIAALLIEQLSSFSIDDEIIRLDLSAADIEDPVVTSQLLKAFRDAAQNLQGLEIHGAPQVLAHGLYRIGALGRNAKLRLINPREEIGTSS